MQANLEQNAFRNKSKQIRNNKQNLIMQMTTEQLLLSIDPLDLKFTREFLLQFYQF